MRMHWSQQTSSPTTQEKALYMDITRWSTPKSDWLYSLQPKMEKLYTVSKNKTGSWLWLRSWTPYCHSDLRSHTGSSTWDLGLSSEVLDSRLFFNLLPEFRPLNSLIHCFYTLIVCMPSYVPSARVSIKCSGRTKEV